MAEEGPFTDDHLDLVTVQSREELAERLRTLHLFADKPSLRDLKRWAEKNGKTPLAPTTISEMLAGKRLPSKAVVLAFAEACAAPTDQLLEWERAWRRVARREHGTLTAAHEQQSSATRQAAEEMAAQQGELMAERARLQSWAAELERLREQVETDKRQAASLLADARERRGAATEAETRASQIAADTTNKAQQAIQTASKQAEDILKAARYQAEALGKPVDEPGEIAARVLALAQVTVDQAIKDARGEAGQIVASARGQAAAILGQARAQADNMINAARDEIVVFSSVPDPLDGAYHRLDCPSMLPKAPLAIGRRGEAQAKGLHPCRTCTPDKPLDPEPTPPPRP